jgi:hypothetical protein
VIDKYNAGISEELIQRVGGGHRLQILILEPLFEEKNRTRRLIAQMMRLLDARGIGTLIPDLPGAGESLVDLEAIRFEDWQSAVQSCVEAVKPSAISAIRGGCLLDAGASSLPRWWFAPETGARIARDLERMRMAGSDHTALYGGHRLKPEFIDELRGMPLLQHAQLRTVRLETDTVAANHKVAGTPLWRRAEPGEDAQLAEMLADDLASWIQKCAAK